MKELVTKTLGTITEVQFNSAIRYFKQSAPKAREHWENSIVYAVGMMFATGDCFHINKLLPALEMAGRLPLYEKTVVAHDVVPFSYDREAGLHTGKIKPGRRAVLETERDGVPQWEIILKAALSGQRPENKEPPKFKLETRLPNLIAKAFENGYKAEDIRKLFNTSMREAMEKASTPVTKVQEVKKGQEAEKKEQRKAA